MTDAHGRDPREELRRRLDAGDVPTSAADLALSALDPAGDAAALVAARGQLSESGRAELDQLVGLAPVVVVGLTADVASRAGDLLARARRHPTSDPVSVATVAFAARVRAWPVVTSDPAPLLALDGALEIDSLP